MKDDKKEPIRIIVQVLNDDSELVRFLKSGEGSFDLPDYLDFPMGKMDMSKRGRRLMLAGLELLKERFPKKDNINSEIKKEINKNEGWA